MDIKLSIIIPIYKEEDYIDECLESVLNEINLSNTPNDQYEVIVVSDGASDLAIERILKYEKEFNNFKIIKNTHKGAGAARNLGIKEASGEYISFIDADDMLHLGFLKKANELLEKNKDLYIFGLKRIEGGKVEYWTVEDKEYDNIHDFADEYIKNGHLLIYSNCNKLYKNNIIKDNNLGFNEELAFGEDRLFNYEYLKHTNNVITSSVIKHDYIKRREFSQSNKHYDNYFSIALKLHKERTKCFLSLKRNVTEEEIKNFASTNLINEINSTIDRFNIHKEEEKENIDLINSIFFEKDDEMNNDIGIFIILGSNNCYYKVDKALELSKNKYYMNYIVSGGNIHKCGDMTEAEFMAKYLEEHGINKDKIYIENKATNTIQNFEYSYKIAKKIIENNSNYKIGLVTSDFHMKRTKFIAKEFFGKFYNEIYFFNSSGPNININTWYKTDIGKNVVFSEIKKMTNYEFDKYLAFINS